MGYFITKGTGLVSEAVRREEPDQVGFIVKLCSVTSQKYVEEHDVVPESSFQLSTVCIRITPCMLCHKVVAEMMLSRT